MHDASPLKELTGEHNEKNLRSIKLNLQK